MTALPEYHMLQLNRIARLLVMGEQFENASNIYKTLANLAPNDPNYNFELGYSLYRQGLHEAARAPLEKAVKLSANQPAYRYHLGLCYTNLNRNEDAYDQFKKAVELKDDKPDFQLTLGDCLLKLGRTTECISHLEKAAHLFSRSNTEKMNEANLLTSMALAKSGNSDDAIYTLRQAYNIASKRNCSDQQEAARLALGNFLSPASYFWATSCEFDH